MSQKLLNIFVLTPNSMEQVLILCERGGHKICYNHGTGRLAAYCDSAGVTTEISN